MKLQSQNIKAAPMQRRSFLSYAAFGMGVAAIGMGVGGLVRSMGPSADIKARRHAMVDLKTLQAGKQLTVRHEDRPIFVVKLADKQIEQVRDVPMGDLYSPSEFNAISRRAERATFANRSFEAGGIFGGVFVVLDGICPRLGCVPIYDAGDFNGWFCPCGGAHFDLLGRIRKGPAPSNMSIPRYSVSEDQVLSILPKKSGPSKAKVEELLFGRSG